MLFYLILYSLLVLGNSVNSFIFPKISEPTTARTYYVDEDKSFSLTCRAEGNPKYKWIRDGKVVIPEKNVRGNSFITFDPRYGDLTIEMYNSRFDGEYTCLATIRNVTIMSQPQTLLAVITEPFKTEKPAEINVGEYNYLCLKSGSKEQVVQRSHNSYRFKWFIQPSHKIVDMSDRRKFIDDSGNLHFAFVKKKDKHTYQCGYVNNNYGYGILGNSANVSIKMINAPKQILPRFRYGNSGVTGIVESSAQLECFFSGYDPKAAFNIPTINWFSGGKKIIKNTKHQLLQWNRVLVITDLKKEDEKEYFCQAFSSGGRSDKHTIYLNVSSKPIWVTSPKSKTITVNEDAVFNCNAGSLPNEIKPDTPEWYINGKIMSESTLNLKKYLLINNKKTLIVKNVGMNDIQCVQCIVKNSVGSVMENACLDIITTSAGLSEEDNESMGFTGMQLFWAFCILATVVLILSLLHFGKKSRDSKSLSTTNNNNRKDGGKPEQDDDQDNVVE